MHECPACGSRVTASSVMIFDGVEVTFECTYCQYRRTEIFPTNRDYFQRYATEVKELWFDAPKAEEGK